MLGGVRRRYFIAAVTYPKDDRVLPEHHCQTAGSFPRKKDAPISPELIKRKNHGIFY